MLQQARAVPGLAYPAVVAHRGASAHYPENTLVAFDAAVRAGADMIELDARLTADGVAVVMHDQDVARTTDGAGFVCDLPLSEVRVLNVRSRRQCRVGVPTLREALARLRGRAAVEIDIKNDPGEPGFDDTRQALAGEVLTLLDDLRFRAALVTSENPRTAEWVRRRAPGIVTGVEIEIEGHGDLREWLRYSADRRHAFLLPNAEAILDAGEGFVDDAHALGIRLGAWTVDDPRTLAKLLAWGVDIVETNDPQMAVPIRDRVRAGRT